MPDTPEVNRPTALRVRDKATGAEFTTYVLKEGMEVLKNKPALDSDGKALPAVPGDRKKAAKVTPPVTSTTTATTTEGA